MRTTGSWPGYQVEIDERFKPSALRAAVKLRSKQDGEPESPPLLLSSICGSIALLDVFQGECSNGGFLYDG